MAGPNEPAADVPASFQTDDADASLEVVPETFATDEEGGMEEEEGASETFRIEKKEGVREVVISIKF